MRTCDKRSGIGSDLKIVSRKSKIRPENLFLPDENVKLGSF